MRWSPVPEQARVARTVAARRFAYCFDCGGDTVQTLRWMHASSPGSYRGTRMRPMYTCGQCGGLVHG